MNAWASWQMNRFARRGRPIPAPPRRQVLEETGMTEEELARVFDLRRPMPE